ncbi:MAG TPA: ABC transporter substrate-binding protein [Solirubrobacteraceae bacterium]|nr:ABC transporter substrate-binding protein [Solirubrobacteraceae bacterium]
MRTASVRRAFLSVSTAGLAALVVAACGSSGGGSSNSGSGSGGSVKGANLTVVQAGGSDFSSADVPYFVSLLKKEGINAHLTAIADASSATRAVIAGQAQLGINDLEDAILPIAQGHAPIKIIAANNQASDYVLVAQKNITLQNASGKTLGIDTPGSAGQGAAELGLKASGVNPQSIRYVTVGDTSARETAVVAGKIGIAPVHYPVALAALGTGKVHEILNIGKAIGPYLQSALIANDSFLKNKALAKAVIAAFIKAERWADSSASAYIAYAKSQNLLGGLPTSQAEETWNNYHAVKYFGVNGGVCPTYVNKFVSLSKEVNLLPKNMPATSQWLDPTLVQNYLTSHGQSASTC